MLIISENRKCGEGLPDGQQKKNPKKNSLDKKKRHFLTTRGKKVFIRNTVPANVRPRSSNKGKIKEIQLFHQQTRGKDTNKE